MLAKPETLNWEDDALLVLASELKDAEFIQNQKFIRQKLIVEIANPMNAKANLKDFAKRNGVQHKVIVKMVATHGFQAQLAQFIQRFWLEQGGYGDVLAEAIRQLRIKAGEGNLRAIEMVIKLQKLMGRDQDNGPDSPFEKSLAQVQDIKPE
jgi:hypothetical protein